MTTEPSQSSQSFLLPGSRSSGSLVIPAETAAVVLAAGGGTRFRDSAAARNLSIAHKLVAPLRGKTVFECALTNVLDAGFSTIIVVTGSVRLPIAADPRVEEIHNEDWANGQATSLATAIDALTNRKDIRRLVVGLGDQPFIPAEAWQAVAVAEPGAAIVVATYEGKRRNPVRLDRSVWDLVPKEGDEGARPLFRSHGHLVIEVACQGEPADIDTAEDLLRWS